ncbi:diguanylate cyclase [Bacillus mesophilus]|uniref:Diguanylate cyclase n=1 Tax=Bacillus mesophilus TaxID=1808955 RepID=A0A6M0Q8L1_9BACI|nr:diguanylate cyclase [Bacillus mesophilus]MBM7662048.1 diguanylate cyclase [Bacillus mesophilus]NEY72597.1 diguanylate cyclase [Bacillus mesophilus]
MNTVAYFFFQNMALIIAFMFLYIKLKDFFLERKITSFLLISPLLASFLSLVVMLHPLEYEGMKLDLREVPLFFISFIGGWKWGLVSSILPSLYRFSLGGPTVIEGIMQSILLPVLIGSLFYGKGNFIPETTILNLKKLIGTLLLFEVIKSILMIITTPITVQLSFIMSIFAVLAVLGMGLMLNDANRSNMMKKELLYLSNHDSLTHLPNIRWFKEEAQKQLDKKSKVAIAMFDVDYFKKFNDTNGHQAGDEVLRDLSQLLADHIGKEALIARYGGEEFIIFYKNATNRVYIEDVISRFKDKIEQFPFIGRENIPEQKVTISVGISFSNSNDSLENMIKEADQALYESKNSGRNKVTVYSEGQTKSIIEPS